MATTLPRVPHSMSVHSQSFYSRSRRQIFGGQSTHPRAQLRAKGTMATQHRIRYRAAALHPVLQRQRVSTRSRAGVEGLVGCKVSP